VADQLSLAIDPQRDKYHARACAGRLLDACRDVAKLQGYKATAAELDEIFGPDGHHVSESLLYNALNGGDRNYWRGEWVVYFARKSPLVAAIVAEASNAPLSDAQVLQVLAVLGVEEFGPAFKRLLKKIGRTVP
jgi:hypothetical protein